MRVYTSTLTANEENVIVAFYEDAAIPPAITANLHPGLFMLTNVPQKYVDLSGFLPVLKREWREALPEIIDAEAQRRIEVVLPSGVQAWTMMQMIHGVAADKKEEIDRVFSYVEAVKAAANLLRSKGPIDPCADANWPQLIDRIEI